MATNIKTKKQEVFKYVELNLGGGMIDVELDPDHYETALETALSKFRQRSDNSVEESYMFLPTVIDQNDYTLPSEVVEVRKLFRRSIGSRTGGGDGGTLFEPFNLAYTNTYLLASSNMGGLATYNAFAGYQELVCRKNVWFVHRIQMEQHYKKINPITASSCRRRYLAICL